MKFEVATRDDDAIVAQFLVSEFESLSQRAIHHDQNVATKTNFYLAIVTVIISGLFIASNKDSLLSAYVLPISCLVLAFLLILGLITLSQIVDLAASAKLFYRRAGRIRRWFCDFVPSIETYLPFTVTDTRPPFVEHDLLRGVEASLLFVNAAVAATGIGLLFLWIYSWISPVAQFLYEWIPQVIAVALGVPSFILVWNLQVRQVKLTMGKWESREEASGMVRFQTPKN